MSRVNNFTLNVDKNMPTVISSQKAAFRPELLTQQASREALSPMEDASADYGSKFSKAAHF